MKRTSNAFLVLLSLIFILNAPLSYGATFISGVQIKGSDITEPNPRKSAHLKTYSGGFGVITKGAAYQLIISVEKPFDGPVKIVALFQNPLDKKAPFKEEGVLQTNEKTITIGHGPVPGLRIYGDYWVKIRIYDLNNNQLIEELIQPVRSYVDSTTSKVEFYKGLNFKDQKKLSEL